MRKMIFLTILMSAFFSIFSFATEPEISPNVLVIHAYHLTYDWTFNQSQGIQETILASYPNAKVFTEFLDWKRFPYDSIINAYEKMLLEKYKEIPIDVILTTDDKALSFAIDYRKQINQDIPIVFGGIIAHTAQTIIGDEENITGVYEQMDPYGALELMGWLQPDVNKIYLIHDLSESGFRTGEAFLKAKEKYDPRGRIETIQCHDASFGELIGLLSTAESDAAAFLISYNGSSDGLFETPQFFSKRLSQVSKVPIYSVDEYLLGHGILGGRFLSGHLHGQEMGQLALSLINGAEIYSLPHVDNASAYTAVDEEQLRRYGLKSSKIQTPHLLVNEAFSFVKTYSRLVFTIGMAFLGLGGLVLVLVANVRIRKKSQTEVLLQKMELQSLNEELITSEEELRAQNEALLSYQDHLEFMAMHDALTKLPNRYFLETHLKKLLDAADPDKDQIAVVFVDVDNFKFINNTYGHPFGDHVLEVLSDRLTLYSDDFFIARLGGDEFILVIDLKMATPDVFLQHIKSAFAAPIVIGKEQIRLSASIGYSLFPADGQTVETLMTEADLSMHHAKREGKATTKRYAQQMSDDIENDYLMIAHLKEAYEKKEFMLHYQPQIHGITGEVVGFEALLRWESERFGTVSPARIIPLAESSGLIVSIGRCILEQSFKFINAIKPHLENDFTVSVNISAVQLMESGFEEELFTMMDEMGILPHQIKLEITESIFIGNNQQVIEKLNRVKTKGIGIALDDFGTGYSSLAYFEKLPITEVKIDKSFIDAIELSNHKIALIDTIISLARAFELDLVAEGVETEKQREHLIQRGCFVIQGYLNSKPLPLQDVIAFCEK